MNLMEAKMNDGIVTPVLDVAKLQEIANEAAMEAATKEIKDYYGGYSSPFRKQIQQYLKESVPSPKIEIPNIVEEIQKSLVGEVEKIAKEMSIKNCISALRKGITHLPLEDDGSIKLSKVFDEMKRDIDIENGEWIEADVKEDGFGTFKWLKVILTIKKEDCEEKRLEFTLHDNDNDDKHPNTKIVLSMPYHIDRWENAKIKIKDNEGLEIEMPMFHGLANDPILLTIAKLVMYRTPVVVDTRYYHTPTIDD